MVFRFRHAVKGSHVWVNVFCGPATVEATFAKIGELVMRPEDWEAFEGLLRHHATIDDGTLPNCLTVESPGWAAEPR
jgi:hypothetical protein